MGGGWWVVGGGWWVVGGGWWVTNQLPTTDHLPPTTHHRSPFSMRIVSLLPSATEIICALGLEDQLVGVTHECDYPPSVARLPKVTKTLIPTNASSREIDALVRDRLGAQSAL